MAYDTLSRKESREEYDDYLDSVGVNMNHKYEEIDPEEVKRRRKERGKKRFMEDFDFSNNYFFNMFQSRFGKTSKSSS